MTSQHDKTHQNTVDSVVNLLSEKYGIETSVPYFNQHTSERGEMDIVATTGDKRLIFEVKSAHSELHYQKAVEQLKRSRRYYEYMMPHLKTFLYYVGNLRDGLIVREVK
mgnify:CR=1 FL=1